MIQSLTQALESLKAHGLRTSSNAPDSLLVFYSAQAVGDDMQVSHDASVLLSRNDGWIAIFPSRGLYSYEIPGTLDELVQVMMAVYDHRKTTGEPLSNCFEKSVACPEKYLSC